jgi:asparagine synthase (glutamine-hydrolysing)
MCGIAGFFGGPPSAHFTDQALCALASRGPDGSGVWKNLNESVALIHTRLAILDLTEASSQPMVYQNGAASLAVRPDGGKCDGHRPTLQVLVFNGEIYNYRELRRELEAQGETFISDGDTEVLLRLLVREGAACLPKLAGMFAFAFWNQATGEALLARDPLGIKPLYYRQDGSALAFASEVRVLRRGGDAIHPDALRDYFLWGSVPDPQTLHRPVQQLEAGHFLRWKDGSVSTGCWYHADPAESRLETEHFRVLWQGLSAPAVVTRVALEESMARHLVSDVPVGIFLSGGIDSTVLLALARNALGPAADIRTFSIGFADPDYDESTIARRTAEHFGAHHTEWMMTAEEGAAEIPEFLKAMDQPGIDGFNTWCVSKLARREGMKVVLSGLGGDELFAGYSSFERVPQLRRWHAALGIVRPAVARMMQAKPIGSPFRRLAAYLKSNGSWLGAYHAQRGIFTPQEAAELAEHLAEPSGQTDWEIADLPGNPLEVVSLLELTRYMRYQLLRDSDVYSMAHGLELRVPFVDVRMIESISGIPAAQRLRQGKQLLLEAVPEVPEWVRNQPKRGFRFPFQNWMENGFSQILDDANRESPVPLNAWYRTWAVAAAVRSIKAEA